MNIPVSPNRFISQEERMRNLRIKPKQLAEIDKESEDIYIDEDTYSFPDKDSAELIDWEEYEKTLDKANVVSLIIKPNFFKFKDNKLILKDYPKLETLYAAGLGLKEVGFHNLPQLKNLYLPNNELKDIGNLESLTGLVNLVISDNQFAVFPDFYELGLTNLECLICNNNRNIRQGKEKSLIVFELTKLKYLDCSKSRINELIVEGCVELQVIDADINNLWSMDNLANLDFPPLPKLRVLSLRSNNGSLRPKTLTLRSPNLEYLNIYKADIRKIASVKLNGKLEVINQQSHEKYANVEVSMQAWEKQVDRVMDGIVANSTELDLIRHLFGNTHIDFSEKEKSVKEEAGANNSTPPLTNPALLTSNYLEHPQKDNLTYWTATHLGLTGTMVIENWPKLESLNLGNNYLSYLVVRNCPKLKTLRYAHNMMRHDVFIENCPRLSTIDNNNYHGGLVWDQASYEQFAKGELHGQEAYNQRVQTEMLVNDLLTNPQNYTLAQIDSQLNFEQVPLMERGALLELLRQKKQEKDEQEWKTICEKFGLDEAEEKDQLEEPDEPTSEQPGPNPSLDEQEIINHVINESKKAIKDKDWRRIEELITYLKTKCSQNITSEQQNLIQQLKDRVQEVKNSEKMGRSGLVVMVVITALIWSLILAGGWRWANIFTNPKKKK